MIKLIEATGRYPSHIAGKAPMRNTGFTLKGETAMNIVRLVGEMKDVLQRKGTSNKYFLTFVDLKSAFDRVPHEILFKKLKD